MLITALQEMEPYIQFPYRAIKNIFHAQKYEINPVQLRIRLQRISALSTEMS